MSDLNLKFLDDGTTDAGPGRYADKRAFDVLQRYLQSKISVKDAANAITAILPEPGQSKTRGGEISLFGSFLCQMAEQIPYSNPAQARLVQLVQHVSLSPKLSGQGDDDGYMICFTMDDFKSQLREWFTPTFEDDPEDPDQYSHALNFSGFLARLTQSGFISHSPFPIWAMREALEVDIDHRESLDSTVSSAALWIAFAGQVIYTQVVEAPPPEKAGGVYNTGRLYGGSELGLERWRFWKEALIAASKKKDASEECRRLADKAANLMDVIEQSMTF